MDNPSLLFLQQIRDNLDFADYSMIKISIRDLKDKAIPTAILHKGWYIDRVRINEPGQVFHSIADVNYITNPKILNTHVGFGRANEPRQAVFYGSILSEEIQQPRAVAYFETSDLLSNLHLHSEVVEVFTLSRWRIKENIEIVEMIYSEEALKQSKYVSDSVKNQQVKYAHMPLKDHYDLQGRFFSEEFARQDIQRGENYKYKISAAYANDLWNNTPYKGITYPSVKSLYKGQNVALLPEIVDRYLQLEVVGMFKFERKAGINLPIDCFKIATDIGPEGSNFKWTDFTPSLGRYFS